MPFDSETVERRKPIWSALSELYLDTELQPDDFIRLRRIFQQSGYSIDKIKQINYEEVAPILISNLLSVAGVWGGFDEVWLAETILKRLTKRSFPKNSPWWPWLWKKQVDFFTGSYFNSVFG